MRGFWSLEIVVHATEQPPVSVQALAVKISRVKRCHCLPRNAAGRDFVVGDLHGHRSFFEKELDRLGFSPDRDRVLSVGDLIDRGPESLATLALIEEPWFFAVLGNHELALLNHLGHFEGRGESRRLASDGCSDWRHEARSKNHKTFGRLAERVASLPIVLHIEGDIPFNVTHGDLYPIGSDSDNLFGDETICIRKAEAITSSRRNVTAAMKSDLVGLEFARHSVHISPTPLGVLPMTYVGHTPTRYVMVHNSYVHIDQGVCARSSRTTETAPTVLDHREFADWLRGVAIARTRPGTSTDCPFWAADLLPEAPAMA